MAVTVQEVDKVGRTIVLTMSDSRKSKNESGDH